jgi:peroxiredoxin
MVSWKRSQSGEVFAIMTFWELKPRRVLALASVCLAGCALSLTAEDTPAVSLGRVAQFELKDVQGKTHTQKSWAAAPAIVHLFLGTECPVANGYAPEMSRLAKQFAERGVVFVGVHCDPDVTAMLAAQHAREYQLTFPILLDPKQTLAKPAGVHTMSAAVVLSPDGEVVYRGRIDDR